MRSPSEIAFRLRQEAWNLWFCFGSGAREAPPDPVALPLPRPQAFLARLKDTPFAQHLVAIAEGVLRGEVPLFDATLPTGPQIRWRRDYATGIETQPLYFRRIRYLDARRSGDHKRIWELNRHQHLVALAQAHLLTGRAAFLDALWRQLESWLEQNPPGRGINWTSALEAAFRSLSWIWIEHLAGPAMPAGLRRRWLACLFAHGRYIERNLSVYFSPNTHLQGEAVALHALGLLFGAHPEAQRWRATGAALLETIVLTHVRPDGGHFEQSSYYHLYATDLFLFHALLAPVSESYRDRLRRMGGYLWALASSGRMPLLGDDDGGRCFHPFGDRRGFPRATLATCAVQLGTPWHGDPADLHEQAAWWLGAAAFSPPPPAGPAASALFPDSGLAVLNAVHGGHPVQAIADTRAFGFGGAGHSHAHALHFVLRYAGADVLIDPGTYTYVAEGAPWRDLFRGTAAHNTVTVDGLDQALPAGPFRWRGLPATGPASCSAEPWSLRAECRFRGLRQERQMLWLPGVLFVLDRIEDAAHHRPGQLWRVEQIWHPAGAVEALSPHRFRLPAGVRLLLPAAHAVQLEPGWSSDAPGRMCELPVLRVLAHTPLPCTFAAAFLFPEEPAGSPGLRTEASPDGLLLEAAGRRARFFYHPAQPPQVPELLPDRAKQGPML